MRFNPNEYATVNERVGKFYEDHPQGRINTEIVEHDRESGFVLIKASVFREPDDAQPAATGHAYEVKGGSGANATSHVENCETSAVGRALALMGYEVKKSIASREEMQKVERMQGRPEYHKPAKVPEQGDKDLAAYSAELNSQITELLGQTGGDSKTLTEWANKKWGISLISWQGAGVGHKEGIAAALRLKLRSMSEKEEGAA